MTHPAGKSESTSGDADGRIAALEAELAAEARGRAELIHLVSHELRTPITVISGFARLLLDPHAEETLGPRAEGFASEILKACRRMDAFVGELIEVGPDAGDVLAVMKRPAQLAPVLKNVLKSMEPILGERGMKVSSHLDDALGDFDFDAGRIEQVLTNLLTNAMRYGREGGVIQVGLRKAGEGAQACAVLTVEDDGPGIPAVDRERIFSPYVRGAVPSGTDGLGIGLAICRRIIDSHSGTIRVEEGTTGGALFVVELPLAPSADSASDHTSKEKN